MPNLVKLRFNLASLLALVALCALALWFFHEGDPVYRLTRELRSQNAEVRTTAAAELRQRGPAAIAALTRALQIPCDPDADEMQARRAASAALAVMGAEAANELIPLLASEDKTVQSLCVNALGQMGGSVVPQLGAVLTAQDAQS